MIYSTIVRHYFVLLFFGLCSLGSHSEELSFGVVPQQAATALATSWIPLLSEISKRSGVNIVFRTAPDIPTFEERLKKGEYDLAYMNPYHYVVFHQAPGYGAFAQEKGRQLVGIVVVRKDSTASSLKDLAGQKVAFPAPAAFAASILPRGEFSRHQIDINAYYVASLDSVYRGVVQGAFAGGGGIQRTLESMAPDIAGSLRVIATTPKYTPHAFAAHPRVTPETLNKIRAAMLSMEGDEEGRRLLAPLSFKGIVAGEDKNWDQIRELKLDLPVGLQRKP